MPEGLYDIISSDPQIVLVLHSDRYVCLNPLISGEQRRTIDFYVAPQEPINDPEELNKIMSSLRDKVKETGYKAKKPILWDDPEIFSPPRTYVKFRDQTSPRLRPSVRMGGTGNIQTKKKGRAKIYLYRSSEDAINYLVGMGIASQEQIASSYQDTGQQEKTI